MSSLTCRIWFRLNDAIRFFFVCSFTENGCYKFSFSFSTRLKTNCFTVTIIFNIFARNRALTCDIIPTSREFHSHPLKSASMFDDTFVQSTNICQDKRYRTCSRTYESVIQNERGDSEKDRKIYCRSRRRRRQKGAEFLQGLKLNRMNIFTYFRLMITRAHDVRTR